jgi:hypothetical protein
MIGSYFEFDPFSLPPMFPTTLSCWIADRCLTVSFHKHGGDFFPGTGDLDEVGVGAGK